jgi:hypothetical protein
VKRAEREKRRSEVQQLEGWCFGDSDQILGRSRYKQAVRWVVERLTARGTSMMISSKSCR